MNEAKKKPERKGAWWRKYTKEFLDEPKPVPVERPAEVRIPEKIHQPVQRKIIFPKFETHDPFSDIEKMQKEMDNVFKNIFRSSLFGFGSPTTVPRIVKLHEGIFRKSMIEVKDLGKAIAVRAEIPGVKKEDIKIRLEGRNLILDAHSRKEHEKKTETAQSFSQSFSGFRNVVRLPTDVDKKSIRAKYENGILTVILEKKKSSDERWDIGVE